MESQSWNSLLSVASCFSERVPVRVRSTKVDVCSGTPQSCQHGGAPYRSSVRDF